MDITIFGVNNGANEEARAAYDENRLLNGAYLKSDFFSAADVSHKLIVSRAAVRALFDFIEWDIGPRPDARVEQGGVLLGRRYFDAEKDVHFAVVSKVLCAADANASSGSLEITRECWGAMYDQKDEYNLASGEDAVIVGWFHTHPNLLSCDLSDIDRNTQRLFFDDENTYSLVINPQRHLIRAFRARECRAAQAFLLLDAEESPWAE